VVSAKFPRNFTPENHFCVRCSKNIWHSQCGSLNLMRCLMHAWRNSKLQTFSIRLTPAGTQTFACEYRNIEPVNFSSIWRKLKSTLAVCSPERVPKKVQRVPGRIHRCATSKDHAANPWSVCAQAVCIRSTHAPTNRPTGVCS
jgi:hypothetical protein